MPSQDFKITNEWVALSDLVEVQQATEYFIQNKGGSAVICCRTSTEPEATDNDGTLLLPNQQGKYVEIDSSDLYLKSCSDIDFSTINIDDKK